MIYGHKVRAGVHPSAFCSWPAEVSPASEALSSGGAVTAGSGSSPANHNSIQLA